MNRDHAYKVAYEDLAIDTTLTPEQGWRDLKVRWLVTGQTMGSEQTVVGVSVFPPGAAHELHRHPNAEEWEYVIKGEAVKRVGDDEIPLAEGDTVFVPRDAYHGVFNPSDTQTLVTIWGYSGASDLDTAGYLLPESEPGGDPGLSLWPAR